ncbi:hypothetical protein [Streptomyces sp. N35]|uniref:hypothetical protein n=1 Tax=Streptomyces sp. N35 TaxID=2795730 RepID=UPI0018F4DDCE|nr:hypothetical protein [Streptomyces sp. N35]
MKQIPALWFVLYVSCALCKAQIVRLELARPGAHPASWFSWPDGARRAYLRLRDTTVWWLIIDGNGCSNGLGQNIAEPQALRYRSAFRYPRTYSRVHSVGLPGDAGFCSHCDVAYCDKHWLPPRSGAPEKCPRGHAR